jgi:DNA-binding NtrC family response regulator
VTPSASRILVVAHGGATDLSVRRPALSEAGFDVDMAETASGAIGLLAARRYAAIVTDCDFPDLPPLDCLAAIRGAAPKTRWSFTSRHRTAATVAVRDAR